MQFPGMNRFTNDGVLSITVFSKEAPCMNQSPNLAGSANWGSKQVFFSSCISCSRSLQSRGIVM